MSESDTKVRSIEPFGFWPTYASALGGMGGEQGGPDPYYCFHTPYLEYEPGGVIFRMRLIGARATMGELALRVHAWRADNSMDAVLVGGMRIPLEGLEGDHEYAVKVTAVPGVIYAFFARYTQPSDLAIDDLELTAEELADEDATTYAPLDLEQSPFAPENLQTPSHLTLIGEPTLRAPLSQPFMRSQLADQEAIREIPGEFFALDSEHDRWRTAYAWQALVTYNMAQPGASGSLRVPGTWVLRKLLERRGVLVSDAPTIKGGPLFDFLVAADLSDEIQDGAALTQAILRHITGLRRGGLGIFLFHAKLGGRASVDAHPPAGNRWVAGEQDIQRAALRVIGHGSDVAQIVWPHDRDRLEPGPFGLLVRR